MTTTDDTRDQQPVTVTITTSGASVTITATADLDAVTARATAMHTEAHGRCVAAPRDLGGVL
ncbi:hypothetical protein O7626_39545 [Micromonospora sp. WMMD1102]|uniref:hypothetical protein n=1 Tax=Micromonospora sp. WMMD1102 TaxID=3016105 RepID=UPI002414D6AA|nr:hypothetical protein [Micromonospora sp. WMMD1102]MDG4784334.1 hypothetical protein [Micromonospora sp. WMMD1102]MDG4784407.1 hypothetical protein [Micromonospora sp. WMMD1102]MDG4791911.1 hypothetical protein [Micromonospora sp. WMMD1102]